MVKLSEIRKTVAYRFTAPVVRLLSRTAITPSTITWLGFLLTVGAAILIITGYLLVAGLVVLFAGFFDILDGALARRTNQVTRFGGVLDSTLDRLSEAVLLLGILTFYAGEQSIAGILLVGAALIGSPLVSYIRARAETMGLECQLGVFTRTERVIVLSSGLLLSRIDGAFLFVSLAIIAALSFFTAGQRLVCVWRQTRNS